jgi:hypothetical protein
MRSQYLASVILDSRSSSSPASAPHPVTGNNRRIYHPTESPSQAPSQGGDVIRVNSEDGRVIACKMATCRDEKARSAIGQKCQKPVIH